MLFSQQQALCMLTYILSCVMQRQKLESAKNFATRDSRGLKVLMEMFIINKIIYLLIFR